MPDNKDRYENGMEVIPAGEVKEAMHRIKSDVSELKDQMAADKEATGLELEKRADDMEKYAKSIEDLTVKMDKVVEAQQQNAFVGTFGQTSGELKDALQSFSAGYSEFTGESAAAKVAPGSKPSIKNLVEGVFTKSSLDPDSDEVNFHAPRHVAIRRLQKAADTLYSVDACMRAQMSESDRREYDAKGGMRTLEAYRSFKAQVDVFVKAAGDLIDTTTEAVNWVPTQYSANLYEQIKIGLPELSLFPEISMAAPTLVLPLDMNDDEAHRVTEVTSITNADPYADTTLNTISSNKVTFEAEKLRSRYWIAQEAVEDAIIAMMPLLNRKLNRNMGEALADAIINGQPTNLDTGGTHFGKANPLGAGGTDARDCWDGLRRFAAQYTGTPAVRVDNSNAKATVVAMRGLRAAMGELGVVPGDVAYIFGLFGYMKLLDDDDVMTVDKFGPNATVRTGSMAQVDGVDVIVSRRVAQNMNASGIIDGSTTNRTHALAVNTMAALLANRRRITLDQQKHIASDSTEIVAFWRGDFQPLYPVASVPAVGELYNVASA